jgi:hypothetical protein
VDVIFFGFMPQDFTARTAWKALEDVLPREYPAGSERAQNKIAEVSKNNGAVVTTKPLSIAQKLVKEFQARGIKCRIVQSGLEEDITRRGFLQGVSKEGAEQQWVVTIDAIDHGVLEPVTVVAGSQEEAKQKAIAGVKASMIKRGYELMVRSVSAKPEQGMAEGGEGLPDPQNFDSDNDYRDALDAYGNPQDTDADYENMTSEPDDWFDESKEKIGNMDADAFDAALSRMKKLAGAGPLRTVYDPARRVYKNVPHAVQPAQQPKKAR